MQVWDDDLFKHDVSNVGIVQHGMRCEHATSNGHAVVGIVLDRVAAKQRPTIAEVGVDVGEPRGTTWIRGDCRRERVDIDRDRLRVVVANDVVR